MTSPSALSLKIRPERAADAADIRHLVDQAFAGAAHASGHEARIVESLRDVGVLTSWVAEIIEQRGSRLVGQLSLSPVSIGAVDAGWFGLGPIAVAPAHQRQGIGARMVDTALEHLRHIGASGCVLVGDPGWYQRFGFRTATGMLFADVPAEYLLVWPRREEWPHGQLNYHPAFMAALG
ncbi:GNAT family N-acetyltransferase [Halomonas huangheensis]|uniref:N-acetyltransferase domain-containing protein n=1 Tax=Halomonas huangheensis TaxID=1178482 RepID=W1N665_9GAMM|nr:N-acetyltransferase [Halomonas huangheensis]ALM52099.1 hypothetical protein AR456_07240 [Halomonas huangheensis]ERL50661.1 hypothetical protein BJB45_05885 [Halomonas huangheensis]